MAASDCATWQAVGEPSIKIRLVHVAMTLTYVDWMTLQLTCVDR